MENHHQQKSSIEMFTPSTPSPDSQDSDFEFGCFTPNSPSTDPCKNSPADHLFFNGRLLPHSFPQPPSTPPLQQQQQQQQQQQPTSVSRTTSRTSSVSSKDSLVSSRSNSTNSSRSSISNSARTSSSSSSSDNISERKLLYAKIGSKTPVASKVVMAQLYGSSQRWQHIVPISGLKREDSSRKNNGVLMKDGNMVSSQKQVEKGKKEGGILWKFFRWFLVACRKCHSMEPSTKIEMLEGELNV